MYSAPTSPHAVAEHNAATDVTTQPSSSRLAHLLKTNDIPIDWEIPVICNIIFENQTRVDALNAQIDVLRTTMEELVAERDQRQECVRRHASVVSLVRRVPQELICEILALTPCTRRIGSISISCPPWRLGHICRSWRNWALADPFLWRSIEIVDDHLSVMNDHPSFSCQDAYPLPMIETQLLRCANVPLSVTFDTRDCKNVFERPLWDLLILHCHCWGALRVNFNTVASFSTLLTLLDAVQGRIPQLKQLDLLPLPHARYNNQQTNCFSVAPDLREILLTDPEYKSRSFSFDIPWGQITRYRGRFPGVHQFEIVKAASNLVECGLAFNSELRDIPDKIVTLPHLRRLYVENSGFLAYLTAPILEVLCSQAQIDPLLAFINRSSCRLTTLSLESCLSASALVCLLRDLPSLESLLFDAWKWDSAAISSFLNAMTISNNPSDLCPSLTSLAYGHFHDPAAFSPDVCLALVAMAESRLQPRSPRRLSSLRFFSHYSGKTGVQKSLAEGTQVLARQGLDVAFFYGKETKALLAKHRP
ncbi:hypothetical protein C8R44DRAFT_875672 [Mycena epipterygia]|nr:hypothetical protein C8R44DRAFT_875672 [Mycena epipterygia]